MINVYESVHSNRQKSAVVVALFTLFILGSIYFISRALALYYSSAYSGLEIAGFAFIVSGITSFASYYWSDKIILTLSRARKADRKKDFHFYTVAQNLSLAASLPMPDLYVIDDSALNAFATGRDPDHAVVCATSGLLTKLDRTELEGVVAHELSHVANYDTRLMSLVAVMVGIVALLADFFLRASYWGQPRHRDSDNKSTLGAILMVVGLIMAILSPLIAQLIQLAISRRREFLADAQAVKLTRQPSGLISALKKLGSDTEPLEVANKATAHMYIVNPFKGIHGSLDRFAGLFNTHPPLTERIKALENMA